MSEKAFWQSRQVVLKKMMAVIFPFRFAVEIVSVSFLIENSGSMSPSFNVKAFLSGPSSFMQDKRNKMKNKDVKNLVIIIFLTNILISDKLYHNLATLCFCCMAISG